MRKRCRVYLGNKPGTIIHDLFIEIHVKNRSGTFYKAIPGSNGKPKVADVLSFRRPKSWSLTATFLALLLTIGSARAENRWLPLPDGQLQRIAFGSCAKQWQAQPIWQSVIAADPDLFLFLGDAIYADTDGTGAWNVTAAQLAGEWNRLADKPEIQELMASVPVMATWDNHDYGTHSGGAEFPLRAESQQIFLDFFDEPADSPRRQSEGIYDAKIFGPEGRRIQIILLDTRYFKRPTIRDERTPSEKRKLNIVGKYAPNPDPAAKLLGKDQWAWLEEQLKQPAELRLIAAGTQIIRTRKEWTNGVITRWSGSGCSNYCAIRKSMA